MKEKERKQGMSIREKRKHNMKGNKTQVERVINVDLDRRKLL